MAAEATFTVAIGCATDDRPPSVRPPSPSAAVSATTADNCFAISSSTPYAHGGPKVRSRNCDTDDARSIGRFHGVVVEVHVTVGFRPEPDAAADRRRPVVLQSELAVEIAFDLLACDIDLEVVPGACRSRCIADPFDLRSPPILELPEHEIVLERI